MEIAVFWFRRDLRLEDNVGLSQALKYKYKVLPLFIFDENIISELPNNDARISFIYESLQSINKTLIKHQSSLLIKIGQPIKVWQQILEKYNVKAVFINRDYEPYAIKRDQVITSFLEEKGVELLSFKDQVIFEENDILKKDNTPYTVYTPYKNKWLDKLKQEQLQVNNKVCYSNFYHANFTIPSLTKIGFKESLIRVKSYALLGLNEYKKNRDFPAKDQTSYLSPHLRFGTVSIRKVVESIKDNQTFLEELIWREFFMQILFHFPTVVTQNFKPKYNAIKWRNNEKEFELWCLGKTGYPLVDAGMRQLNKTGYMHNRVRMIVASFLCKHLLIDWRWGEAYFAEKLLDYELSSNNGNWQWAASTGCDAVPYFRIFNPHQQIKRFDNQYNYIKKWVPEYNNSNYHTEIVEHTYARKRALAVYKAALNN